jgi:protein-tyrosine-phosphatase
MKYNCSLCGKIGLKNFKTHLKRTHQTTEEHYLTLFPEEVETYEKFLEHKKYIDKTKSPNSIEFYLYAGMTEEEAKEALEAHRKKLPFRKRENISTTVEYWVKKGYTEYEAKKIISSKQKERGDVVLKKYGNTETRTFNKDFVEHRKQLEIDKISIENSCSIQEAEELYRHKRITISPRRVEYWLNKGYTEEESKKLVSEWQKLMSPRTLEYWVNKGYSIEEAKLKQANYQDFSSITAIINLYDCSEQEAIEYQITKNAKVRATNELNSYWIPLDKKSECELYYRDVWRLTEKNYKKYYDVINPNNVKRGHFKNETNPWHLDHKYSIKQGFLDKIDYSLIASVANLQIILGKENIKKKDKCSISLEELKKEAAKYEY